MPAARCDGDDHRDQGGTNLGLNESPVDGTEDEDGTAGDLEELF